VGGQLRYVIGGQPGFDQRALLLLDAAIGVRISKPARGDSFDAHVFARAGIEPVTGRFARSVVGIALAGSGK
jgi:hypothetical protein